MAKSGPVTFLVHCTAATQRRSWPSDFQQRPEKPNWLWQGRGHSGFAALCMRESSVMLAATWGLPSRERVAAKLP